MEGIVEWIPVEQLEAKFEVILKKALVHLKRKLYNREEAL